MVYKQYNHEQLGTLFSQEMHKGGDQPSATYSRPHRLLLYSFPGFLQGPAGACSSAVQEINTELMCIQRQGGCQGLRHH